jgi:hypothetical protein
MEREYVLLHPYSLSNNFQQVMPETALFALPDETDVSHAEYPRGGDPFVSASAGRLKTCLFFLLWMLPQRGMIPLNGTVF